MSSKVNSKRCRTKYDTLMQNNYNIPRSSCSPDADEVIEIDFKQFKRSTRSPFSKKPKVKTPLDDFLRQCTYILKSSVIPPSLRDRVSVTNQKVFQNTMNKKQIFDNAKYRFHHPQATSLLRHLSQTIHNMQQVDSRATVGQKRFELTPQLKQHLKRKKKSLFSRVIPSYQML